MAKTPWTNDEVRTFLCVVAEDRIQRELDGATRNERIYREVSELMAAHGYQRTSRQCREKLKKLKCDYRSIKEHNSRSGAKRRDWKWFDLMDGIYGHRPASNGRESGPDSATVLLERIVDDALSTTETFASSSLVDSPGSSDPTPAAEEEEGQNRARRDQYLELMLNESREARKQEACLRREEMAQTAAFNQAFLGVLGDLVRTMSGPRA